MSSSYEDESKELISEVISSNFLAAFLFPKISFATHLQMRDKIFI